VIFFGIVRGWVSTPLDLQAIAEMKEMDDIPPRKCIEKAVYHTTCDLLRSEEGEGEGEGHGGGGGGGGGSRGDKKAIFQITSP
jgi:uncharacterized membrane protein YgcG